MRVLFTLNPGIGHFHPLVLLAQAVIRAGHEVLFATARAMEPMLTRVGFPFVTAGIRARDQIGSALPDLGSLTATDRADFVWRHVFAGTLAHAMAADLVTIMRTWRPHVLVREESELGGCVAAERLDIPHVAV